MTQKQERIAREEGYVYSSLCGRWSDNGFAYTYSECEVVSRLRGVGHFSRD